MGDLKKPKGHFEINWPLASGIAQSYVLADSITLLVEVESFSLGLHPLQNVLSNFGTQVQHFNFRIVIWHIFWNMEMSEIKPPLVTFLLFLFSINFKFELRDNLLEIMTNMTYLSYMSYQPFHKWKIFPVSKFLRKMSYCGYCTVARVCDALYVAVIMSSDEEVHWAENLLESQRAQYID